jgi:hypothetical protein
MTRIDYYTTGDGEELCADCARLRYPGEGEDADEHGVSIDALDGWGGPVFTTDEGPDRAAVCDDCGEVLREEPTPESFALRIDLGNEAMSTPEDVADALLILARKVRGMSWSTDEAGKIMDDAGNSVGEWWVEW